jgi:serine/threonine protein phosphatase 1
MSYQFIDGPFRRTIVVGDIHGCLRELGLLLRAVGFGADDLLIGAGDFMDRGPASWEVARFFRDAANASSVLGNHERRIAGAIRGTCLPAWTQELTISRIPEGDRLAWADYLGSAGRHRDRARHRYPCAA